MTAFGRELDPSAERDDVPAPVVFRILGPLQVLHGGRPVELGSWKQQQVLAVMLCNPNSPVAVDLLVDVLWADRPPRTARKNLQVYISGLRALVGATRTSARITHHLGGYVFSVDDDELDWLRFERKVRDSRQLWGREPPAVVARALSEALELWSGPPLEGMRGNAAIDEAAQPLEMRFVSTFEDWAEAEVATGASFGVAERIAAVAQRHPFRERLRMAQMIALNQIGRRTEALGVFDELRRTLAGEFGLPPSDAVVELHRSLLCEGESGPDPRPSPPVPRSRGATHLLPRDVPAFTGRHQQTREILQTLTGAAERLAVITGSVGAGKTALAVHVAHRLRDHFPDGCHFVRLRGDDGAPRPVAELTSRLMGTAGHPGPDQEAPTAAWQRWLSGRRALVVLDDARRESEVRPLLPEAGESTVIVTARNRLPGLGWAHRTTVPIFTVDEAVELLRRIIGPQRVDTDLRAAQDLAAEMGGLPLAVRIVGDKLAGLGHLPLREYLLRLRRAANLLDELAVGDVSIRPQLAAAVADLPPSAAAAVHLLASLPRGSFALHDAADALDLDLEDAQRTLELLLEANIIAAPTAETTAHEVVYEMSALIRAYGRAGPDLGPPGPAA